MRDYVKLQTSILLRRLAYEVTHAAKKADADAVHDLRVSIRRLNRCLRVFSQFYPGNSWKKVRRRLGELMGAAGEVRDRDIAIRLLHEAGVPLDAPPVQALRVERDGAVKHLIAILHHWKQNSHSRKWREQLGL